MKQKILLILSLLLITATIYAQKTSRKEYIATYKDIAIKQMKTHGIPASITLAQGCLESGDGNSTLAKKANNHFGIKCHDWKGPSIRIDDDKKNECFRKYKHAEDSYNDHGDFLRYRERYGFLFNLKITDYKAWAHGLKKAGYATNPHYAQMLIKIIEENNLMQYDKYKGSSKKIAPPSPAQLEEVKILKPVKNSPLYKYSVNRTVYEVNGVAYIIANKGDTYKSIAKEYNLFRNELLRFNDLTRHSTLRPGSRIFLQNKKNKAKKHLEVHFVEEGDTYHSISQRYGVKLKSIAKYNHINTEGSPHEGDEIYLRRKK